MMHKTKRGNIVLVTCVVSPHTLVGCGCPTIQAANDAAKLTTVCVASVAAARRGVSARLAAPALHVSKTNDARQIGVRAGAAARVSVSVAYS